MTTRSDVRHWTPAAAVAAWITVSSVVPPAVLVAALALLPAGGGPPSGEPLLPSVPWDKVGHAALYGVFAPALLVGTRRDRRFGRPVAAALVLAAAFGAGVEVMQSQLPWRSFELLDGAANTVGAALGLAATVGLGLLRGRPTADEARAEEGEPP